MLTINNTIDGAIQDIEIKGNTVQNPDNLADIKSVGELQEDGTYKMSILSCGKNLFYGGLESGTYQYNNGVKISSTTEIRSVRKIKVNPNSNYIISSNKPTGNIGVYYYDSKENFIKAVYDDGQKVVTTEDTHFIAFRFVNLDLDRTVQIEEGTVATPYEPYQENKCDILLPCQLEKVGDVADRLYYDDVEKAWCIEKNIETVVFNGSEDWNSWGSQDNDTTKAFYLPKSNIKYNGLLCNKFEVVSAITDSINLKKEAIDIITPYLCRVRILKSRLSSQDLAGFKTWLSQNPTLVKYQLATPQKIVLPLSTQIALNSFFGTTHIYMESGEVEGTIKCKIPKSLGATVQSLNNKTDILSDRIEAIEGLKDSQNMKYETDKGYLVCKETKNGVIDDLKVEGKTLVNRTDIFNKVNPTGGGVHRKTSNSLIVDYSKCGEIDMAYSFDETNVFKSGRIYTIIIDIIQNTLNQKVEFYPMIWDFATVISGTQDVNTGEIGRKIFVIKANKDYALKLGYASPSQATQGVTGLVEFKDIMVLDGDYTNIELPNYFEGLMSVGEDVDKIEVLSCNENLFDAEFEIGNINNGVEEISSTQFRSNYVRLKSNTDYITNSNIELKYIYTYFYDKNKNYISVTTTNSFTTPPNCMYIRVKSAKVDASVITKDFLDDVKIGLVKSKIVIPYTPHQSDKKQILFYNENGELEPIQELHEWDSIEKHSDNKWYYHKRSGKVVLNGSESDDAEMYSINDTLIQFNIRFNKHKLDIKTCVSDKFSFSNFDDTTSEGIQMNSSGGGMIVIRILKSKLSSQDVAGFKQWLQTNNVTVVYQLAQEEVYELAPLHLDSYANETLILCNSGAISPKMEFSITSHINELVKAYGERINLLEEKVYQYMVTQNRMQLASTYSADSVTFKVDYFSLCGDEENYDEDLYNLILNNILVGKDNYDYDKMFTIILDYASWNQISWEQFDILVGLMDIQHNPPVEELPTEDRIEEDIIENEETPVE